MSKVKDIAGERFGRWTVMSRAGSKPGGQATWNCVCDCGTHRVVSGAGLRFGNSKSCGCVAVEKTIARSTTHGKGRTRLYSVWCGMKERCTNPNASNYYGYGARGITICDEWFRDFQEFYDWSMANGYDESAKRGECTLDRIDVDGNYEPGNCRWVSMMVQAHNKRPTLA